MEIGRIDDKGKGKGKSKDGKGKDKNQKGNGKGGKDDRSKNKDGGKQQKPSDKQGDKCPICWRQGHKVEDCWFNAKGAGKNKGGKSKGAVNALADDASTTLSIGPSVSMVASAAGTATPAAPKPAVRHVSEQGHHILKLGSCPCKVERKLLVDTGACVSVCRPGAFQASVDAGETATLFTVDDTPLDCRGTTQPLLKLGAQRKQTAVTSFQVVEGITDDILAVNRAVDAGAYVVFGPQCWIQWADGSRADFVRHGKQFVIPYEELSTAKKSRSATKVAAMNEADDPEAAAVEAHALRRAEAGEDSDLEAAAVEEFARREEPDERAEEAMDLEEQAAPQPAEPSALSHPASPSPEEVMRHELTHVPYAPWCEACLCGAGRAGQHRRKVDVADGALKTVVQADYTFFQRGAHQALVEDESTLVTVLTLVDSTSGWPLSVQVPKKGSEHGAYVMNAVELYLNTLGHRRVTIQIDQENSLKNVAKAIQVRMGADKVHIRESPAYSHQSQGRVEGEHARIAGLVRTLLMDVQKRYSAAGVDVNHVLFPWMVRHAAWLTARFQVRTRDKATPYRI